MKFRKLRIAWSVFWGVACVLLIMLCVRSYWWADCVHALDEKLISTNIGSNWGELYMLQIDRKLDLFVGHPPVHGWRYGVDKAFVQPKKHCIWFVDETGMFRVGIRHWVLILPTIALATVPWIPMRFSLRTLLIATTLVALVLGIIVWMSQTS